MNSEFAAWWAANLAGVRHFTPAEFLVKGRNPDGLNTDPPPELWPNVISLVHLLEAFRVRIGAPVRLSSVYRSPAYNMTLPGAASGSQHLAFRAADITAGIGTPADWAATFAEMRRDGVFSGGIGIYDTFVHVDVRGRNADWDYRTVGRGRAGTPIGVSDGVAPTPGYRADVDDPDVRRLQTLLNAAGYNCGNVDGRMGRLTRDALRGFRDANGLPRRDDDVVTDADWLALARAEPATVSSERAGARARDLRHAGSRSIRNTDRGLVVTGAGGIVAGGGILSDLTDAVGPASEAVTFLDRVKTFVGDMWPYAFAAIFLVLAALFIYARFIRVDDQRKGRNLRPIVVPPAEPAVGDDSEAEPEA